MKTSASNKRIRELIIMLSEGRLLPKPEFQRRLVWTNTDKDRFIDSILRSFPFPEIYICDGEVDTKTGEGNYWLVDGLQRVSTIDQYFQGSPDLRLQTVPPYSTLTEMQKKNFLQYEVAVRDLGAIDRDTVVEVFKRINATKYSLNDIEINNAVFQGAFKNFCEQIAQQDFFVNSNIFTATDYKRMGDTKYIISVITAMLRGYTNRDDAMEDILSTYNDNFAMETEIRVRLEMAQSLISEAGFSNKSRLWRKADLYTLIVELDNLLFSGGRIEPIDLLLIMEAFYDLVDSDAGGKIHKVYHKATIQASNDKINRMRRGLIVGGLLSFKDTLSIERALETY